MVFKTGFHFILVGVFSLLIVTNAAAGMNGIRPAEACNLLNNVGLPTLGWKTYYDDECGCSSRSRPVGREIPLEMNFRILWREPAGTSGSSG